MAQSGPKPGFIARVREPPRDLHLGLALEKEFGISVHTFRQVGIQVEVIGVCLDHSDYLVGGDRQPEAAGTVVHELSDDSLASLVKLFALEIEALDGPAQRIAKGHHFFLLPVFTPSAL